MRAAVLHDFGADPVVESFDDPEAGRAGSCWPSAPPA